MKRQRLLLISVTLGVIATLTFALAGIVTHAIGRASAANLTLTQYVNPFIGTTNQGDTFPGAVYPTGMVQWSPDTTSNPPGGYYYGDNTIKNFTLTNFSGRGCSDLQDIPFMPYVGAVNTSPATSPSTYYSTFTHSSEAAAPGYYKVHLDGPNVTTELTATARTGQGQFTYQPSSQATMLINPGGSINGNTSNTGFTIVGNNEVTGYDTTTVGCGGNHYTLYFAAYFDHTFTSVGTWNGSTVNHGATSSTGAQSGAYVTFGTNNVQVVHVRVGISFVSLANAQANLTAESPNFDFAGTRSAADAAWNTLLNTIQVAGGTTNETIAFYTALYHSLIHPNIFDDSNGQYLGFDNKVHTVAGGHHQYENISSWDLYRSLIRLRAIITPGETADIAQSLVNDAQQGDGHLPRWEQLNGDSFGMNGDGADVEIADAYAYGDTGFDTAGALTAMVNGQHITRGTSSLNDYVNKGYVTQQDAGNSAVATQEYTNDDFALAQFAKALGNTTDYTTYLQRSNNWVNLFDNANGGYIFPKNSDGSYASTSITSGTGFQETDSSQSTWMESFDLASLFSKMGGNAAVVSRLDTFFTKLNDGFNSQYAYMGNEPNEEAPWGYDWVGAPSHTASVTRRIETQLFTNTTGGIPGNDDGGATSSWLVFADLGIYPDIPGVAGFVFGSPLFTSATIQLAGGHTLQINAPNASDTNQYVQSLALNGTAYNNLWLPWSSVQGGATLAFTLGSSASSWGTSAADAPPSFAPSGNPPPATFNNEGISNDNDTTAANFDGSGYSYSNNALAAGGFSSGSTVTVSGISFRWPTVAAGTDDNWSAGGQVISIPAKSGGTLGFLGAATGGPSSGTATITYIDGTTQTFTLAFSDWTLNHDTSSVLAGDSIALKMTYRNGTAGQQANHNTYVFYTSVGLPAGKTVKSVTLPGSVSQGTLHVLSIGIG